MVAVHTMRLGQRLTAVTLCLVAMSGHATPKKFVPPTASPAINITTAPVRDVKRPITLDDMVSLREVHEPRRSPDGSLVAFLVKQAFRPCDCYRVALYVVSSTTGQAARKLVEEDYIANVQWASDGKSIFYLSGKGGSIQLWHIDVVTQRFERLFVHAANHDRSAVNVAGRSSYLPSVGIMDYRLSPDGHQVAFTAAPAVDPALSNASAKSGFLYDDAKMETWDLIVGDWGSTRRSIQLWFYDIQKKSERLVWSAPSVWGTTFPALIWSPSGHAFAFFYTLNGVPGTEEMGIVDVPSAHVSLMGGPGAAMTYTEGAAWSADERQIAYLARPVIGGSSFTLAVANAIDGSRRELARDINPGHSAWVTWDADKHQIFFLSEGIAKDRRQSGLYEISDRGGTPTRLTTLEAAISDCDYASASALSCIWQAPSVLPQPALISTVDGGAHGLIQVNPEMESVELGPVRELHWKNAYGDETNGFLVLPTRRVPGVRVPLVVMGYSFSGEFVAQANSVLTTYPAQAFARDGIAVLLVNYPRYEPWEGSNFDRGSRALAYGPLSSIRACIDQLDSEGLIDRARVGLAGHSMAGFWAQFGITHTDLFRAVEMHNGGTFSEPGTYWESGSAVLRNLQDHVMGGPPYGETLKNYMEYSMTLNAARIRAPVLMEYDAMTAPEAMEYYEAMRYYAVPVDFFVYPNDGHVTERPEHRFMSLQRNLDWFEYWLLGKENNVKSNPEQYARWHQFQIVLDKKRQEELFHGSQRDQASVSTSDRPI